MKRGLLVGRGILDSLALILTCCLDSMLFDAIMR
jgi:hypothetical protein